MSLTKIPQPQQKIFFQVQTRRLAESYGFEQLSRAISRGAMVLVRQPKTVGFRPISGYNIFVDWPSRC